jgi:hypothetical protein
MEPSPPSLIKKSIPSPRRLVSAIPARFHWPIAVTLVAVAGVYAFWPLHVLVRPWSDFAFVCAAGRTWLKGGSPYDFAAWDAEWQAIRPSWTVVSQPMPYVYPPHWAPIALLAAAVPWPVASRVWDLVSVLSFAATAWFSVKLLRSFAPDAIRRPGAWASIAFAALNPAIRYSAWQSQTALFATAGLVGAFWAWREKRVAWLAVLGFIASLKPQVSLPALIYLFLSGGHVGLAIGGAAAVLVGVVAMIPSGLRAMPEQFAHCYALHVNIKFNDPREFSNLLAFFHWPGGSRQFLAVSTAAGIAASVTLVVAARQLRKQHAAHVPNPLWQLGIVAAVTGAVMPVHAYDLVIYTPLVVLAYELRWRWVASLLIALSLFAARVAFLSAHIPVPQAGSYLTVATLLTMTTGLVLRWQRVRHATAMLQRPPRVGPVT